MMELNTDIIPYKLPINIKYFHIKKKTSKYKPNVNLRIYEEVWKKYWINNHWSDQVSH